MPDIGSRRLALLLEKEKAHDDYHHAFKAARELNARAELEAIRLEEDPYKRGFADGYNRMLKDYAIALLRAGEYRRLEEKR